MTHTVFVYGTLLKTMARTSMMERSRFRGPGLIHAELYDLGAYPGIRKGRSEIMGEIYEIDASTLAQLDRIEGFDASTPTTSLFVRKAVEVTAFSDGSQTKAFAYFLDNAAEQGVLIAHGDYRRHILERSSTKNWVVAYGSNIGKARLSNRVGKISESKKGFLEGFQLVFNKKAMGKNTVYTNIKYIGTGNCPAVVWKLTEEQIAELDGCEGGPSHYLRITVPFVSQGETLLAQSYIAHPSKLIDGLLPETTYVQHIRDGYREHGLSEDYLENHLRG